MNRHVKKAKDYIAKGEGFYAKAVEEIEAAMADGMSQTAIAKELGKAQTWVGHLIDWATDPAAHETPFGGDEKNQARYARQARTALRDPERRAEAIKSLPATERAAIAAEILEDEETAVEATKLPRSQRTAIQKAAGSSPDWAEKARDARERVERERREKHTLRYIALVNLVERADLLMRGALDEARGVEFDHEETDLVRHALYKHRALTNLVETAALGTASAVDWDAELAKLEA